MKNYVFAGLLASGVANATGTLPSYYDMPSPARVGTRRTDPPPRQTMPLARPAASQVSLQPLAEAPAQSPSPFETAVGEMTEGVDLTDGVSMRPTASGLSPVVDRGLQDIESGMDQLKSYSAAMANHIRRNGLRGFFNTPPELQAQGRAIGQTIGRGIRDVAAETARDMVRPQ